MSQTGYRMNVEFGKNRWLQHKAYQLKNTFNRIVG